MTNQDTPAARRAWTLWPAVGLRLLLAAVFAVAGASKLPDPAASVRAVRAYRLLPEGAVHSVAYGLPVLELALAALLLLGLVTRLAAALSAALLVVFLAGIASVAARGLSIDCGCFGGGGTVAAGHTRYTAELLRDSALLAAALALVRWPHNRLSLDRWLSNSAAPPPVPPQTPPADTDLTGAARHAPAPGQPPPPAARPRRAARPRPAAASVPDQREETR